MIHSYISKLIIYKYHYPVLVSISNIIPKKNIMGSHPLIHMIPWNIPRPRRLSCRSTGPSSRRSLPALWDASRCRPRRTSPGASRGRPKNNSFLVTKSFLHFFWSMEIFHWRSIRYVIRSWNNILRKEWCKNDEYIYNLCVCNSTLLWGYIYI